VTTPRRLLVRCLFEASGHRTAEELAAEIQAHAPDVSISTVYRNLEELERLGVVGTPISDTGRLPITSRPRHMVTLFVASAKPRSRSRTVSSRTSGDGQSPISDSRSTRDISL
jgi:Fe2+ or Zn2+ uptake regulation protein